MSGRKRSNIARERKNAIFLYEEEGFEPRRVRKVIDAFLDKGFTLEDIGGDDIVWVVELQTGAGRMNLEVTRVGKGSKLVQDLDDIVSIQAFNEHDGGFYLTAGSARTLLQSFGTFNDGSA